MLANLLSLVFSASIALTLSPSGSPCCGDCNGDGAVEINELLRAVDAALTGCPSCCGDCDGSGRVTVEELVTAVASALLGCPDSPSVETPTRAPTAAPSAASATPTATPIPPLLPGPQVTFLGLARADNRSLTPIGETASGAPIYSRPLESGFLIVVEGRPGTSGVFPGNAGTMNLPTSGTMRPDVQIQVDRPLGNGSSAVCDATSRPIGGVPAIHPPDFGPSQSVTDALNDLACRFDVFSTSAAACTTDRLGNFSFVAAHSTKQFCALIGRELSFLRGDTLVSVQLRDSRGNLGPPGQMVVRIP